MYIYTYLYSYTYIHINMYTYVYIYAFHMYVCIHVSICFSMNLPEFTYRTCKYAYKNTKSPLRPSRLLN